MQALAHIESNIQTDRNLWGGPLSLRIVTKRSFGGVVPDPKDDEVLALLKGFIHDTLLGRGCPDGELTFDPITGRRFHYVADIIDITTRYHGSNPLLRLWARGQRQRLWFWHAEDAAAHLEDSWIERWGDLFEEEPQKPAAPPALAIVPAVVAPPVKLSSRRRGLLQMAAEMEMDAGVLEHQLESGAYNYIVSLLVECQSMVKSGDGYGTYAVRREYLFDKADAEHNVAHRNEPGTVTIKKRELGGK